MIEFASNLILSADQHEYYFLCALLGLATPWSLYAFIRNSGKARLIEDTPTSLIRSASQGYVELVGHGKSLANQPIISPVTGTHCLWWRYIIEKKVVRDKKTHWQTIENKASESLFMLEDKTGGCLIDPEGAEVHPSQKRTWYGRSRWPSTGPGAGSFSMFGSYRYHEHLIREKDPIYALGLFRTQRASDGHFDESSEVSALMKEWKQDHDQLLQRFDVDKDGVIDSREWEATRRVALKRVREAQLERAIAPGLHILSKPVNEKDFIISTRSQEQITRRYRWRGRALLLVFLIGSGGLALMLSTRGLI